jgi:hypothetical protein
VNEDEIRTEEAKERRIISTTTTAENNNNNVSERRERKFHFMNVVYRICADSAGFIYVKKYYCVPTVA